MDTEDMGIGGVTPMMMKSKKRGEKRSSSPSSEKPYKGIRMRKWGKWVAEIREPNKRSRIWLGSYSSPLAAARAYDTAVFHLRGPSARLNFPDLLLGEGPLPDLSASSVRSKAIEVGARVDALESSAPPSEGSWLRHHDNKPDLNKIPDDVPDFWDH